MRLTPSLFFLALITLLPAARVASADLLDDRAITVHSARDIGGKRRELIKYIWGEEGFPSRRLPNIVQTNVPSPVRDLSQLARVDEFRMDLATNLQGLAYHFIPTHPNGELVIVHHGHACTLDDDSSEKDIGVGLQRTINALLGAGYGVVGVFMPHMRPGDCTGAHAEMFDLKTTGSPMKYFLESTAFSLNYVDTHSHADHFPKYRVFHMVGLSGGGWTTTVYAAIDPRIRESFPVAGTMPLYLRAGGSIGDREQFEPSFYRIAGYPDLYIMGSYGRGRKQVQILSRHDDCCFGEAQHDAKVVGESYDDALRHYEARVRAELEKIGGGSFRLEIDETAPSHMISHHAIEDIILRELQRKKGGF